MNEEDLWQEVLSNKYLKNKTLSQVVRQQGDSHFWAGLMEVKDPFQENVSLMLIMVTKQDFGNFIN
jgi:hypothetical protein